MSDDYAKPGDTIEIVNSVVPKYQGKRYLVIECPKGSSCPPGSA